jgi:ribosomal protein S15P/S13E
VVRSFVCSNSESIGLILNVDVSNLCLIKKIQHAADSREEHDKDSSTNRGTYL